MLESCEYLDTCPKSIAYIVDCDECKNIFVCTDHIGAVINSHRQQCEETLHVDVTRVEKETVNANQPTAS